MSDQLIQAKDTIGRRVFAVSTSKTRTCGAKFPVKTIVNYHEPGL
jgi:hypothetical protein